MVPEIRCELIDECGEVVTAEGRTDRMIELRRIAHADGWVIQIVGAQFFDWCPTHGPAHTDEGFRPW